jgi:hypothetical protein
MKIAAILVVVAIVGVGAWAFLHKDQAQQMENQVESAATRAADDPYAAIKEVGADADAGAIKTEMEARKARIEVLKKWVQACKDHSAPAPTLDNGYNGFNYDKAQNYQDEQKEQEQRYKDLQARLDKAYGTSH